MLEALKSLLVGIVQGLTEYLPVSSSGHIELAQALMNHKIEDEATFSVILHLATVLSTVVVLRARIAEILAGLFQFKNNEALHFSLRIVVSMIPAALVGVFLEDWLDQFFEGQILLVGCCLWLTAILLYVANNAKKTECKVGYIEAFWIGVAQMVAILPGVSRSGSTIATAVLLRVDKGRAAEFSFLMVIPLILGKVAKDVLGGEINTATLADVNIWLGFLAAFFVGIFACTWMINLVKRGQLYYFSIYCAIVGTVAIVAGLLIS